MTKMYRYRYIFTPNSLVQVKTLSKSFFYPIYNRFLVMINGLFLLFIHLLK